MTTTEALSRLDAASAEVYRLRLERWAVEWPVGHREREAHRPHRTPKKKPSGAVPEGLRGAGEY